MAHNLCQAKPDPAVKRERAKKRHAAPYFFVERTQCGLLPTDRSWSLAENSLHLANNIPPTMRKCVHGRWKMGAPTAQGLESI